MEIKVLYDNQWIQLKEMSDPSQDVNGYVFSHEKRCDGKIVTILPFRKTENGIEYLLRKEVTPCWSMTPVVSSITGGVENNDPTLTATHELKEEGGYNVPPSELIPLTTMYGTKSSDTIYYLFTVDLTGKIQGDAPGDGSEMEKKARCYWTKDIIQAKDPFVYALYVHIQSMRVGSKKV